MQQLFVLLLCLALPSAAFAENPLFQHMGGDWVGEGLRTYPISGRQIRLQASVKACSTGTHLISKNDWEESTGRQYTTVYWLSPEQNAGDYSLGYGAGPDFAPGAVGHLDQDTFTVEQTIPGTPPIVIHSKTTFSEGQSTYRERVVRGETEMSVTVMNYRRIAPLAPCAEFSHAASIGPVVF